MSGITAGILLVILCTIIEGFAQIFLKKSVLVSARQRLWGTLGIGLFVVEAILYTDALRFVEVSTAYPIGSLAFVVVAILSQVLLREKVTTTRWIGVVLILVGTGLLVASA